MKRSISNIGWEAAQDIHVYEWMRCHGFTGLEIAPTRILTQNPYDRLEELGQWYAELKKTWGFEIPSMQSIWFGRQEKLFGTAEERQSLLDYTRKAIDFAAAVSCRNLVFGCPRNRQIPDGADPEIAVAFFRELGDYAAQRGTVLAMEANPPIYNTNYINDTPAALELVKQVDSEGFLLNLDVGTMIQNEEQVSQLAGAVRWINHVHISEPGLRNIDQNRESFHRELLNLLKQEGYRGYVSIEVGKQAELSAVEDSMNYLEGLCHDL